MALIKTHCDLCGSAESVELYRGNVEDAGTSAAVCYSSSRVIARHSPIVRCNGCGLVRSSLRDDDQALNDIYTQLEDINYERESSNRRRTANSYLHWVRRFCHQPLILLDIGCSTGIFLSQAGQSGWNVFGLEPSRWAANIASIRIPASEIIAGSLAEAHFPAENFDVVTMWDVIEHLPYPSEALSSIHPWLKPSGWLFLNVPDIASLPARLLGARWMLLLREHIWYFSPSTLQAMLAKCGFRIVSTRANLVWFSVGTILSRLNQSHNALPDRFTRALMNHPGLSNASIRFPIGEITVAAQKV
jgi:2-polyprenyl-3-methyl-5-hydroxy-6-metoxy-1,4-benzoquinol methylase